MANAHTTTVIEDGARNLNVNLTGVLDTSDMPPTVMVSKASCAQYKPPLFRLDDIEFSVTDGIVVFLWWEGTPDHLILPLSGRGILKYHDGGLHNDAYMPTGALKVSTTGYSMGTAAFTIQLSMVKCPAKGGY